MTTQHVASMIGPPRDGRQRRLDPACNSSETIHGACCPFLCPFLTARLNRHMNTVIPTSFICREFLGPGGGHVGSAGRPRI